MASLVVAGALLAPAAAAAQTLSCTAPAQPPRPRPDLPSADQPQRILPIGGYTLAITWAPGYCRAHGRAAADDFECSGGNRFGFTLHGLWPDGVGPEWPQYCRSTALLPPAVIRATLCATPSVQLLQHEWAKHGTCTGDTPAQFFQRGSGLYAKLRYPDMDALSRAPLTVGKFAAALAAANPGLRADMIRVTASRQGWLDEVWLCLDKSLGYTRCRANSGGADAATALQIWRGGRSSRRGG